MDLAGYCIDISRKHGARNRSGTGRAGRTLVVWLVSSGMLYYGGSNVHMVLADLQHSRSIL